MSPELIELFGATIGFLLTLLVFSYLLGDNPLYRIALHLFVGVAAGYAVIVVIESVLLPRVVTLLNDPDSAARGLAAVSLLLGWLVLLKISKRLAPVGNVVMGLLVGIGAAVAIGGAVLGTLLPQTQASFLSLNPIELLAGGSTQNGISRYVSALVIIVGTICALIYFYYGARRLPSGEMGQPPIIRIPALIGQVFVTIALASLYAGVIVASFALLSERVFFMYDFVTDDLVNAVVPRIFETFSLN